MNPIFVQAGYYGIVMALTALILGVVLKGFLWRYIAVRISFGEKCMVRNVGIDKTFYRVGHVEESFLVFKTKKNEEKRINLKGTSPFYRSMAVTWIDIDDQSNAILTPKLEGISTFDAVKYDNLYKRTLTRPQIADSKDKLILGAIIVTAIVALATAWMVYQIYAQQPQILAQLAELKRGVVVGGGP